MHCSGRRYVVRVGGVCVLAWLLAGCEEANTYVEPPPPKVSVAQPLVREVTDYIDFTGTTVASERVEVRARVSGILQSMHFTPGTDVDAGDLLFVIDPQEYLADLKAAEAEVAGAKAQFTRADTEFKRAERLFKQKAGSEADVVKWQGERAVARAAVQRAEARVSRAQLDLDYTRVKAPISGRVGRNLVDMGNLVGGPEATDLTDITRYHPMHVYFDLNERDLLRVMALYRQKVSEKGIDPTQDPDREAEIPLQLGLATEEGYPHEGVYDFGASGVDPGTGTLRLRGAFDNQEVPVRLVPGLFARVRMPIATRADMPLITERAIGADQSGTFVLAVNSENLVEKRTVRLGQLVDGLRVIEEGVGKDDRIIVNGLQRARPGAKVEPEQIDMATLTESARRASGAAANAASAASDEDAPPHEKQP